MQPVEHSEFPLWCWRSRRSGARSGCLERKGEERGYAKKGERHEIIPRKFLLQKDDGEADEDGDSDDLFIRTFPSAVLVEATTDGVVPLSSEFSITAGLPPSMVAIQEFVVPKLILSIFAIKA